MHKKYNKSSHRDHYVSASNKGPVRSRKENDDSALENIKVPQNSRSELTRKLTRENENKHSDKDKHKQRKSKQEKSSDRHGDNAKHEKKLVCSIANVEGLVLDKEIVKHKEKREKRDKERFNKIEKYLEGLNKCENKKVAKGRSHSVGSSESIGKNLEKRYYRQKTFHHKERYVPTISKENKIEEKNRRQPSTARNTTGKKRKQSESKERESSSKSRKDSEEQVLYCQVEMQNPYLRGKGGEHLDRNKEKCAKKRSLSRESCNIASKLESTTKNGKVKTKDKREPEKKFSPAKARLKADLRSSSSLGLYEKHVTRDIRAQAGNELARKKKKKHRKTDNVNALFNEKKEEAKTSKPKPEKSKKQQDISAEDQYKERIEDDIKSYFLKIQALIDKKLDFILGGSNSKETKNNLDNQNETDKTKRRKERSKKEEILLSDRHHPKRKKNIHHEEKYLEEEPQIKLSEEEKKITRKSRRSKDRHPSNTSTRRERYPSGEPTNCRRSPSREQHLQTKRSPVHNFVDNNIDVRHHKRYTSPYGYKLSPDRLINMVEHPSRYSITSKPSLIKQNECIVNESIRRTVDIRPNPSSSKLLERIDTNIGRNNANALPEEDGFVKLEDLKHLPGIDRIDKKALKKRIKRLMNLECKTISIVGIPSQARESTIFNQTQTTTSLNAVSAVEDVLEKKKQSKRFKLYYKYSVADNKHVHDSDKSSDGKKSIISDSYRVVSDPSDSIKDNCGEEVQDTKVEKNKSDENLAKVVFIMKKDTSQKSCGDALVVDYIKKNHRNRSNSPHHIPLNNIIEEPSNISVTPRKQSPLPLNKDIDCTFFKKLKSSSSESSLRILKKRRMRNCEKCLKENIWSKSPSVKTEENYKQSETNTEKKVKCHEKPQKKVRKTSSQHKIKKNHCQNMSKFTSKSDINISYDSLRKYKFEKERRRKDSPSHFKEQLKYLLPEVCVREKTPTRKDISLFLKEELREIIKEIPRELLCHSEDSEKAKKPESGNKLANQETKHEEVDRKKSEEKSCKQEPEEKKYCSKKTGTHHGSTKIPTLIKGYLGSIGSQNTKEEEALAEEAIATEMVKYNKDISSDITAFNEESLVDVVIEANINEEKEISEEEIIILKNKKSQTPRLVNAAVEAVELKDATNQCKYFKKSTNITNVKRCKILDPFIDTKIGCTSSKATRPIINLENTHFPNRKDSETRSVTMQYKRQKSSLSEGRNITVEKNRLLQTENVFKRLQKRPATAEYKKKPETPLHKVRKKVSKPFLTISTNTFTISNPVYAEKSTETILGQSETSNKNIINLNSTCKYQVRAKSIGSSETNHKNKLASKSTLSLNDVDNESRVGSLVSVEKFNRTHRINLIANSNSRSLDRDTSVISDTPHSSRLFFTKSFSPPVNTYQRRKLYDESIRQKMRKKAGSQNQMGPRVFEVRYLTLQNETAEENSEINKDSKRLASKCSGKLPTFNTKINKVKPRKTFKPILKKSKNFPKKEEACKFSGRDIFAPVITDVDQLTRCRRKIFPEKKVEEIFMKDNIKSSEELKVEHTPNVSKMVNKSISALVQSRFDKDKIDILTTDQNFRELIDNLYSSILSYCNSKFNLPNDLFRHANQNTDLSNQTANVNSLSVNEKSYVILRKPSEPLRQQTLTRKAKTNAPIKKKSTSGANLSNDTTQMKQSPSLVRSHLSCPVLAGSNPSFEYLYEAEPIELDKDAVLLHLRKPANTILGYALNNPHRYYKLAPLNVPKKEKQYPVSGLKSDESGYSSNNSKKCLSATSFFKKPSIANLFKPVKKLEADTQSSSSLADSRYGPNLREYDVMNQKCIEYAEKVRIHTQGRNEYQEAFQEIPLDILLLCNKSSSLLNDYNSKCSLCKLQSSTDQTELIEDGISNVLEKATSLMEIHTDVIEENRNENRLNQYENQAETMIFYEDANHKPSLEIIAYQKSQTDVPSDDRSELIKEMIHCPVVLSITNLNTNSLTIVDKVPINNNESCLNNDKRIGSEAKQVHSNHKHEVKDCTENKSSSDKDFDDKSDTSSTFGFKSTYCPNLASKNIAKKFFENLLKVYEREITVTHKLYRDDDFFLKVLLESVKSDGSKSSNAKLKNYIKGKIRNYIPQAFSKNSLNVIGNVDAKVNCGSNNNQQRKLQILASDARKYFSMYVQAVRTNKDINDEMKICGLLRLLERIEDGDFTVLRRKEVDFEQEIREQVRDAFIKIYQVSAKEANKRKRSLTTEDLKLIRTFVSKYRIGFLSKTDLIATYIGRGVFKTEGHLKAAITYLIKQNKNKDIDLRDFDEHCKILSNCTG